MKGLASNIVGLVLAMSIISPFALAQTRKPPYEGMQPYVPTRLEWLALELNATLRVELSIDTGYSMAFLGNSSADTIVIFVRYSPTVNREIMNKSIEQAKKTISMTAESNGWSSWLKVKEDVEMGTLKK